MLGDVALVSDSGMPTISDPGYRLVQSAIELGCNIMPVPGASAVLAAISVAGLPTDSFVYLGFLPRRSSERKNLLRDNSTDLRTLICFESPHRLLDCLEDIHLELGNRKIVVARELTKLHEEIYRGDVKSAITYFLSGTIRGEFTIVISGSSISKLAKWSVNQVLAHLDNMIDSGKTLSEASRDTAQISGWTRQDVYSLKINN